jgi:N-methylhydantoinase B
MYASDGSINPALGARGGLPGGRAQQYKREAAGRLVEVEPCGDVILRPDETIVSVSCGGGGYGPPTERDPERVRHDVAEGWVTRERAIQVYGVVLDAAGAVDRPATQRLRETMAAGGKEYRQ